MLSLKHLFHVALLLLLPLSCGKKESDAGSGGQSPLPLTAGEQISGEWSGVYRGMEGGHPTSDAYMITASFEIGGKFVIMNPNDPLAFVKGSWSEFQGKSLLLSISESSIPKIGMAGALLETSYDLVGSQLRFGAGTFEIKLTKKAATAPGSQPGNSLFGQWRCESGNARLTTIEFFEPAEYRLASQGRGERIFIAKGTVEGASDNSNRLLISQASEPVTAGSSFNFSMQGSLASLRFNRPDGTSADMGTCRK